MFSRRVFMLALSVAMIALVGCGRKPQQANPMNPGNDPNRPKWADQGGGFFDGDKGKAFYGVGAVSGMKNVSLRRTSADTQARADIARVFKLHIANLVKVYQREVSDIDKSAAESLAQEATKAFTSMDLSGSMIVERYFSVQEGTQYSLAILDLAGFESQIDKMNTLSKTAQELIKKNADQAFDELDNMEPVK